MYRGTRKNTEAQVPVWLSLQALVLSAGSLLFMAFLWSLVSIYVCSRTRKKRINGQLALKLNNKVVLPLLSYGTRNCSAFCTFSALAYQNQTTHTLRDKCAVSVYVSVKIYIDKKFVGGGEDAGGIEVPGHSPKGKRRRFHLGFHCYGLS